MVGGITLVGAVVLTLAFGVYQFVIARQSHVELDPETFCPKAGPQTLTVLVVDTTDPLNLVQRTHVLNRIEMLVSEIPRYGALEIYTVGPVENEPPQPIFHRCNPGRAAEISSFTENPNIVERSWREGFREPLESTLDRMLTPASASSSPILESIQWVTINALTAPDRSKLPRTLVIVSDLLQHSSGLSLYRSAIDFKGFSRTSFYQRIRAPLIGVVVHLFIVRRDTKAAINNSALREFWRSYFDAQGVERLHIVDLSG
jgi:hypothetical protein